MYKALNIGGQEYRLEYSIEASLYADCVSSLTGLMAGIESAGNKNDIKKVLEEVSNVPQTALTLFYAGLMEAHGDHPDGDGKVSDIQTAKRLIAQFMREHKEDEAGNFFGIMQMCIEQMEEDDFFNLTGMTAMMESMTGKRKKQPKVPQDHKRPSGK